jgi:pilus assembly protein CpaF
MQTARKPGEGDLAPDLTRLKEQLHRLFLDRFAGETAMSDREGVERRLRALLVEYRRTFGVVLDEGEEDSLIASLLDDVLGLGPLEPLITDPEVTEIMINSTDQVFVERGGRMYLTQVHFRDTDQLNLVIDRIVSTVGRRVDESSPMADARLRDGSRVNVILPPLALRGPTVTIRKFPKKRLRADDLVQIGTWSPAMLTFIAGAVRARLSILVSGGTSTGKTTLLNVLSAFIPTGERIITIEDAAELQLQQQHVVPLEARPANIEGRGQVGIRDLVRNALRMRPDRIVVGEVRGAEALDMLQAMNTGHEGSISTLHANSPGDALARLETLAMLAGSDLPALAIRKQIASAIHLVVQMDREQGGARKLSSVVEILGMKDDQIETQELFSFVQTGVDINGEAVGYHTASGRLPAHLDAMRVRGEELSPDIFKPIRPNSAKAS